MFDTKEYYIKNREKIIAYSKEYKENNKEKIKKTRKKQMKQWRINNSEKISEYNKKHYIKNKEKILEYGKKWRKENREKVREQGRISYEKHKEEIKKRFKKWKENNPNYYSQYMKKRWKTDLKFNLNYRIRKVLSDCLKGKEAKAGRAWQTLVGYTLNDLLKRLKLTMPLGYTWQDYLKGKLHIDHIIPIRAFIFKKPEDEEFKQCWSLHNLRLLPAKENISKNDSITNPILLGLLLKEA